MFEAENELFGDEDMLVKTWVFILSTCLLFVSQAGAESSLPYPQSEAVKRQTMNMNEIERELEQQLAIANQPMSPQQQALLAQFNQGLKENPQLQAQFEAATPEQQAAFMAQFGIIMPGVGQDQQFAFIQQRLDSVLNDLEQSGAAREHSQVAALYQRVDVARQRIAEIRNKEATKTEQGLAANNTEDFPEFEIHLQSAINYVLTLKDAVLASREIVALGKHRPAQGQAWPIESEVNGVVLQRHKLGIDQMARYRQEIEQWSAQYQPLFQRSAKYNKDWSDLMAALNEVTTALNNESPRSTQVLAAVIEHNLHAMLSTLSPSADDTNAMHMAESILTNRARYPERRPYDAISQIRINIDLALRGYPTQANQSLAEQQAELAQANQQVAKLISDHARSLIKDQRMPSDDYQGEDKKALKDKALSLVKKHYTGMKIHSVAVCCEWDHTQYSEKIRDLDGREITRHYDYRDNQIAVAVVVDKADAKMVVVGVRENFISHQETIEILTERPMLTDNL